MHKLLVILGILIFFVTSFYFFFPKSSETITGAPPYDPNGGNVSENEDFSWISDWKRPDGPVRVALQVGHWKNDEVPEELHRLIGNTGASGGGKSEWEVNYEIAVLTKDILEKQGITVELLPTTIPKQHWADIFVSIHADGNLDNSTTGFKLASPRRDYSNQAENLVKTIEKTYQKETGLTLDPNVSRNMRGYYAFSWWRYEHAIHPMATSVILETGFLTNPSDREIIVLQPELSARGLANGILEHLKSRNLL